MNKDELKERLDEYDSRVGYMKGAVIKITRRELHDLIDQLDEPEKVVVPQFVGEWIDTAREIYQLNYREFAKHIFIEGGNESEGYKKFRKYCEENLEVVMRAWLDGYAVEEKKYVIKDVSGEVMLYKKDSEIKRTAYTYNLHEDSFRLTEKEIKDYDERFWPFAEEVTE